MQQRPIIKRIVLFLAMMCALAVCGCQPLYPVIENNTGQTLGVVIVSYDREQFHLVEQVKILVPPHSENRIRHHGSGDVTFVKFYAAQGYLDVFLYAHGDRYVAQSDSKGAVSLTYESVGNESFFFGFRTPVQMTSLYCVMAFVFATVLFLAMFSMELIIRVARWLTKAKPEESEKEPDNKFLRFAPLCIVLMILSWFVVFSINDHVIVKGKKTAHEKMAAYVQLQQEITSEAAKRIKTHE